MIKDLAENQGNPPDLEMNQQVNAICVSENSEEGSNVESLNSNIKSDKCPGDIIVLEPPNLMPNWTMNQVELPEQHSWDLENLFNENYSNIENINEDNLKRFIIGPVDNLFSNDKSCVGNNFDKSKSYKNTQENVMNINDTPNIFASIIHEKDQKDVPSTSKGSMPVCPAYELEVENQKDKKSTTCSFESLTKDKVESIDFSCRKCKFVNLTCKACISKTKKERNLIVNTMRKTFPKENLRFIKIFVLSAIFEKTRIV